VAAHAAACYKITLADCKNQEEENTATAAEQKISSASDLTDVRDSRRLFND
jgi:hypothetical protein